MSIQKVPVRFESTHISTADVCLVSRLFVCLLLMARWVKPCLFVARVNFWLPLLVSSFPVSRRACAAALHCTATIEGWASPQKEFNSLREIASSFILEFRVRSMLAREWRLNRVYGGESIDQLESELRLHYSSLINRYHRWNHSDIINYFELYGRNVKSVERWPLSHMRKGY